MPKTGLSHNDKSLSTCKDDAFTETFRISEFHLLLYTMVDTFCYFTFFPHNLERPFSCYCRNSIETVMLSTIVPNKVITNLNL